MKLAVSLVFAALCVFQMTAAYSTLSNKLSDAKIDSMQQINGIVNPLLASIERATKESTAAGKDATRCYVQAKSELRTYSLNGFSALDTCRRNALNAYPISNESAILSHAIACNRGVVTTVRQGSWDVRDESNRCIASL